MTPADERSFLEELKDKAIQLGWFALVALVRFLLSRLTDNPGGNPDEPDSSKLE